MNILRSLGVALLATTPLFIGCDGSAKHNMEVGWAKKHAERERERQEALKEKESLGSSAPKDQIKSTLK